MDQLRDRNLIRDMYTQLLASAQYNFPEIGPCQLDKLHGVYIIYDRNDIVLYVGRTKTRKKGLFSRINDHLKNRSSFSINYLGSNGHLLRYGGKYRYIHVADARHRALLEALATGMLCPAYSEIMGEDENDIATRLSIHFGDLSKS